MLATCTLLLSWGSTTANAQAPNTPRAHEPLKLSSPRDGAFLNLATLEQTRHWAPISTWANPVASHSNDARALNLFTPPSPESHGLGTDPILGAPLAYPLAPIRNIMDMSYQSDIKIDIYDALVYQVVSRTIDDAPADSLFNRFDTSVHVRTWEIEDQGPGVLTCSIRANNNLLDTPTSSEAIGAFSSLDVIASDTPFLLRRLEFRQAFVDEQVSLTIGKGNPNDCIASNLFAWDETTQFMAATFDGGNYPVGYGGYMPIASLQVIPSDGFYVTGAVTSGLGTAYQVFSTLDDGLYWCAGETGVVVEAGEERLQGRYSISLMNSNTGNDTVDRATRTSGNAMALVAQQQVTHSAALWSQYLLCSDQIGPAEQELTFGLSIEDCFGRNDDGFGIAIGWSKPSSSAYPGWRERIQLETWYRLQLTETWQFSPDFQVLSRPSDPNAEDRPVCAFALRLLTTF